MAQTPLDDAAARLQNVTDDRTPRQQCLDWLVNEMFAGREADVLLGELVANGWTEDDIQPLLDEAMKRTRGVRSVMDSRDHAATHHATTFQNLVRRGVVGAVIGAVNDGMAKETYEARHRIKSGKCYKCGQDLSAVVDRCPRCATPIVRGTSAT